MRSLIPAWAAGSASVAVALARFLSAAEEIKCMARGSLLLLSKQLGGGESSSAGTDADIAADSVWQSEQGLGAEVLRACSRLMVSVGLAEGRVLGSQTVYSAVLAEAEAADVVASAAGNTNGEGGAVLDDGGGAALLSAAHPTSEAAAEVEGEQLQHLRRWLLVRLRQEGYHPDRGGAAFSVILGREAKLQHLAGLR